MGDGVRKYEDLVATGSLQGLQREKVQPQSLLLSASVSLQGRGDAESSRLQKSTWRLMDNKTPQCCLISGCLPCSSSLLPCDSSYS